MNSRQLERLLVDDEALDQCLLEASVDCAANNTGRRSELVRPTSWQLEGEARKIEQAIRQARSATGPACLPEPDWLLRAPFPAVEQEGHIRCDSLEGERRPPLRTGAFRRSLSKSLAGADLVSGVPFEDVSTGGRGGARRRNKALRVLTVSLAAAAAAVCWVHWKADGVLDPSQATVSSAGSTVAVQTQPKDANEPEAAAQAQKRADPSTHHQVPTLRVEQLPRVSSGAVREAHQQRAPLTTSRSRSRNLAPKAAPAKAKEPERLAEKPARQELRPRLVPAAAGRSHRQRPTTLEVQAALGRVASHAQSCLGNRPVRVQVEFESSGNLSNIQMIAPNMDVSAACVRQSLQGAHVAPFAEPSFAVTTTLRPSRLVGP